ncbi:DUF6069 family protein [Cellulomonas cellasea]|uniref:Uncharacterized protein n=2 Tax=Cellulomonas cellasea TaxID=43670 RepID=A0A0A0BBN8_9CELL|nr:DUF6069 family protein [Cellulomonas cellasea]KGM03309.1 hypothetical protein Q760_06630 [Cellulomonas cellasea DSM 20118]GEA86558.1 hypothetical protein CCE01nite_05070 [Cellulomonas cellasea]
MSTDTSVTTRPSAPLQVSAATTWRTGLVAAGIAGLANLVVLAVAGALGADLLVRQTPDAAANEVTFGMVAVMSVAPIVLATVVLLVLRRWGAWAWRALAAVGLALGLLTVPMPFAVDATTGTQVALATMHVVAGVVWFVLVRRAASDATR